MLLQQLLQMPSLAAASSCRLEQKRTVAGVKQFYAANRDRAQGGPVISVLQADESPTALAALKPPLECHLERDFDGRGTAVGVEHPAQAVGRELEQPLSELDGRWMGETQHGRMSHASELLGDCIVQRRVAMAVNVAPQR